MKKRIKILLLALVFLAGLIIVSGAVFVVLILKDLPPLELIQNHQVAESTKIFDRTGKTLLYEIHGEENRIIIPFQEIPETVKKATIAIEDANFYEHPAFDVKSILRALINNIFSGGVVQGGSTITQQLVKNAFLSPERTLSRKIKELVLAIQIEKKFSKDKILELYLNQIPYGSNIYGIESAAQAFFEKSAKDLSLAEAAVLSSLPKAPTYYSPWGQNKEALLARQGLVLEKMERSGFISAEERKKAEAVKLKFAKPSRGIKAPHFVMMIQEYLEGRYGEEFVRTGGLKVITTLDFELQKIAEETVTLGAKRNLELYQGKNAALVTLDAKTGQLLALVGSKDYYDLEGDGNFNVATQGLRQPGSALKPFVYATAFSKGYTPETVVFDLETEFDTTRLPEKSYRPSNFTNKFYGPIILRNALAQSINIPAVKVLYLTGLEEALSTIQKFGVSTLTDKNRFGLSLVLGGGEVKLLELVSAYSVFASDGLKREPAFILEVVKGDKILERFQDSSSRVFDAQYIRLINDILSDEEARAPIFGTSLTLPSYPDHQVAIKTGTSNDFRDAWSIGYTPSLAVGVWAGNNDNSPMVKRGSSIFAAVPIWKEFMNKILKNYPAQVFPKPEPVLSEKPVFQGQYLINYQAGDEILPQVHNILFYVDRDDPLKENLSPEKDPQFRNWEEPVIKWARETLADFSKFNKPLPPTSVVLSGGFNPAKLSKLDIALKIPKNGDFIKDYLRIETEITSELALKTVEFYFNDKLVASKNGLLGKEFKYQETVKLEGSIQGLQNVFRLVAIDENNNKSEKKIILFSS